MAKVAVFVVDSIPGGDDCVKIGRPVEELLEPRRATEDSRGKCEAP